MGDGGGCQGKILMYLSILFSSIYRLLPKNELNALIRFSFAKPRSEIRSNRLFLSKIVPSLHKIQGNSEGSRLAA
jgi:hypothetical protein